MLTVDTARLEKVLYGLSANAILVFSKIGKGMTEQEILAWSAEWKFERTTITAARNEIIKAFSLPYEGDIDAAIREQYEFCQKLKLMSPRPELVPVTKDARRGNNRLVPVIFHDVDLNDVQFKKALGANVLFLVKKCDLTVRSVAAGIGRHPSYFASLRSGCGIVTEEIMEQLSEMFSLDPEVLATTELMALATTA